MELVTEIQIGLDSRFIFIGNDRVEIDEKKIIGKSLYVGDYESLLKELHELRKDKKRLQFMIEENNIVQVVGTNNKICYSILGVESMHVVGRYKHDEENIYDSPRAAIDAAIAKSEKIKKE